MNSADAQIADNALAADLVPLPVVGVVNEQSFQKLLGRHVAIPLGFGLIGVIFFSGIINYLIALGRWVETTDTIIGLSNEVLQLLVDHETAARGYALTGKEEFLEPYENAARKLRPELTKIQQMLDDNEVQKRRLDTLYDTYLQWRENAEGAIAAKRAGQSIEFFVQSGKGKRLMDDMRHQSADFIADEQQIKRDRRERSQSLVIMLAAGYFVLSLLFSGLMAYWGRRQLQSLAETYRVLLRQQSQQTDALKQQAWFRTGQSRMADQIIGQLPLPILCQNILSFLADYLHVAVGAVYIGVEGARFERIVTYGFSKTMADEEQSFDEGESLVGQAATERRALFLDALPAGYLKVNSGLGEGMPVAVAILPIVTDNNVNAVLELGFLRPIASRDIEFLELISENIGAAMVAAGYRRRLHETLKDMQELNDELQAQQEELRIANEELEEQAQALEKSQTRLEAQQVELEQTNAVLAEQHDELLNKNERLEQTQELLEEHAQQLERAGRYKSEFMANMSHELRTPLNSSLILSKLLADNESGNLSAEQVKFAESIYTSGTDLLALINDVLDISKVEAGKLEVTPDQIVLARMLDGLTQQFRLLAQQKNIQLESVVDADVPPRLFADRHRLAQILRNLLSNAVKFSARGSILLRVTAPNPERIAFAVIDTGVGIDAGQIADIFEPFYQADGTTSRKYGGTGLGLSISRQLAGLLGGRIDVSSEPGVGSVFTLEIPINFQVQRPAQPRSDERHASESRQPAAVALRAWEESFSDDRHVLSPDKKIILVIEDDIAFAHILFDLAHELNYQCLVALTAQEGFELAQRYPPHAVLLDMKLPDHSGLSVLAQLKEEPRTRHVPVHVMSIEDRSEAALQLGAIGYLVKPVSRDQLLEIFAAFESRIAQKMKSVLVAEATAAQATATAELIADADVEVVTAVSGEQALQLLQGRSFDCLIVDLELPDMSCEELLQQMSAIDICSFPPVIVHASRNLSRDEEAKLLRYSRSIIIKSARSPERLLDEVTLFLHKVEADLSSERRGMLRLARHRERALEGRKILVVDDDVRNIFAITSALERKGAVIEIGRNGLDALAKLDACPDIDLVLMDIMMPEMDGYAAMEAIRKMPRFAKLPLIAVTARAMRDDQERCLRAGANDYVAKPVDMDRLISLIRVWLPKIERV